ncbi:hypothetical protein SAMN05444417_0448 [Wenxinia saemankumensis]|uniref:Uncharacterized protein n=1 Tax=Wenxinia saemankumensis TaxID=1447782 RepID=A0A1M6AI50_9RHOB|nr:hypothetical protein SAMN05444417_0448 [Wenxinia saemankumensis]
MGGTALVRLRAGFVPFHVRGMADPRVLAAITFGMAVCFTLHYRVSAARLNLPRRRDP